MPSDKSMGNIVHSSVEGRRSLRRLSVLISSCFLFLLLSPASIANTGGGDYLVELKENAVLRRLQDDHYWRILIHYKPTKGGWESLVDDPRFFLAPDGKKSPSAELSATIDALFENSMSPPVRCRFPARYEWLKEMLPVDPARLPETPCPDLDDAFRAINPKFVSLIFASGNMNAPASMFGHTFLRVDRIQDKPLMSHAVNYAAKIDRRDPWVIFAFKGIFGRYPGYYSILPYHEKVREYTGMEQRDLWEYRLNLSVAETRRMIMHILEMRDIYSDYFFLDENCSYDLLFLLEAARPSVTLTDRHNGFFVTPIDTLQNVLAEGMIDNVIFRPSASRRIKNEVRELSVAEVGLVKSLVSGDIGPSGVIDGPLPPVKKARVLDLASDFMQYRLLKGEIPIEIYPGRHTGVLAGRSRIAGLLPESRSPPILPRPESGHLVSRGTLSGGARNGRPFIEIGYRPAYHSLDDSAGGFNEGSQIILSEVALRWYTRDEKVRIQEWNLIDIVSLPPRDALLLPVSWKVQTGFTTRDFPGGVESLVYTLNPGGGFTRKISPLGLVFFLAETELSLSRRYEPSYTASMGGSAGIVRQAFDRWGVLAQVRYVHGVLGDREQARRFTAMLKLPYRISRNQSFTLEGEHAEAHSVQVDSFRLRWNMYF